VGGRCRQLTPVILATQEAKIRRIVIQSQSKQIAKSYLKITSPKRAGGVAQGVDPEFKCQCCKKPKNQQVAWLSPAASLQCRSEGDMLRTSRSQAPSVTEVRPWGL
jgi:hypothetical protein